MPRKIVAVMHKGIFIWIIIAAFFVIENIIKGNESIMLSSI